MILAQQIRQPIFITSKNGITFLCEEAKWDNFTSSLTLVRAQVVNGGQTLRVLHKAYMGRNLKPEVVVSVRVITSRGDKEFTGNVAVNLNNQTRVESSFLRSNDPRIVQLATALASAGWYLERKEREVNDMSEADKQALTNKLGHPLSDDIIIPLKEGAQSYAATYCRLPGIAKRNPKFIFSILTIMAISPQYSDRISQQKDSSTPTVFTGKYLPL